MRTFFNGWRRKAGCIALVMALVFAGGWVRSYAARDEFAVAWNGRLHAFMSVSGSLSWVEWSDKRVPKTLEWEFNLYYPSSNTTRHYSTVGMPGKISTFQWSDFVWDSAADKSTFWTIGYWSVTMPLTLLSAWLILSKPRPKPA